jgi:GNAT superfamily N-acetyltransferase
MRRIQAGVTCRVAEAETPEVRRFLAREWPLADRRLFGEDLDWTSRPVVVEALAGRELVGVALGEAVAGMARLHDVLVADAHRGRGLGSRLVELFCVRAARLGAARCFLRCPTPTATGASTSGSGSSWSPACPATTTAATSWSTCASPSSRSRRGRPGQLTPPRRKWSDPPDHPCPTSQRPRRRASSAPPSRASSSSR